MCSACMTICPSASNSAVEASRRSLMFEECAERISTTPISSQAARSAPVSTCSSIGSSIAQPRRRASRLQQRWCRARRPRRDQPGGTSSVASGSAHSAGPCERACPAPARRGTRCALDAPRPPNTIVAPLGAPAPRRGGGRGRSAGAGPHTDTRTLTSSTSAVLVAVAVARARARARTPRAARSGPSAGALRAARAPAPRSTGSSKDWPAVAQLVAHARARGRGRRAPRRASASSAARSSREALAR